MGTINKLNKTKLKSNIPPVSPAGLFPDEKPINSIYHRQKVLHRVLQTIKSADNQHFLYPYTGPTPAKRVYCTHLFVLQFVYGLRSLILVHLRML
jgi:hypothetical protein